MQKLLTRIRIREIKMEHYQQDYSKINQSLFDQKTRLVKAKKIYTIVKDFSKKDLTHLRCLEVGCSTGMNINFLSERIDRCVGIDIDAHALQHARSQAKEGTHFISGDAMRLPFRDDFFDIVICNHVYEHVPDSDLLMDEIYRILRTDGFCYFAAGNKYRLIEGHYYLPFLSWLPRPLSNLYLRITRKGTMYYEKHLSYFQLKHLVKKFSITDYTIRILKEPDRFEAEDMIKSDSLIRRIPESVFRALKFFIPVYIFILTKKED